MRTHLIVGTITAGVLGIALVAEADEWNTPSHEQSTLPSNPRYEVVQSTVLARLTFRLDRFTGRIDQLIQVGDKIYDWEPVPIEGLPVIKGATKPRFAIFLSGTLASATFLMDTDAGRTWQYTQLTDDQGRAISATWQPLRQ